MYELVDYLSLTADALCLPHYGSCDGSECKTTRDFIKAVQPKIIFSSSGLQGVYGHPCCEITTPPIDGVTLDAMSHPHCYTCYKKIDNKWDKSHPIFTIKESRAIFSTVTCDTVVDADCKKLIKLRLVKKHMVIKLTINSDKPEISPALQLYTAHSNVTQMSSARIWKHETHNKRTESEHVVYSNWVITIFASILTMSNQQTSVLYTRILFFYQ